MLKEDPPHPTALQDEVFDAIVLGAGIAGLSSASRLTAKGLRVLVLERSDRCGGAHRSANIGAYTFDYGSIFYEENARLFTLAEGVKELCPAVLRKQRRIAPDGKLLHYPIEPRDILRTPPLRLMISMIDMLASRLLVRRDGTLAAILRQRLGGRFLKDTGLGAYIHRFHHTSSKRIDERFFFQRMGFIDKFTRLGRLFQASIRSFTSKKAINAGTRRPLYIRPRSGFEALFAPIRQRLEEAGTVFAFEHNVSGIEREAEQFVVRTGSGTFTTGSVVNTMPLDTLHQAMFGTPAGLTAIDMTTLFVSAAGLHKNTGNVLFNFHQAGRWKRATIYSRLYSQDQTQSQGANLAQLPPEREYLAVEITLEEGETPDPDALFADFSKHLETLGIASGMVLEGSAFQEACYPLYGLDTDAKLSAALQRITDAGVITVGRQGRFEYLPTSSGVIKRVGQELDADQLARTPQASS